VYSNYMNFAKVAKVAFRPDQRLAMSNSPTPTPTLTQMHALLTRRSCLKSIPRLTTSLSIVSLMRKSRRTASCSIHDEAAVAGARR
jgi:hypothetical protein